jgi:Ca-activated chloride channel homolog
MTVKITAKFDGNLVRTGGSERYILFKLSADAGKKASRAPLNLSLIIDRSGSMSSENKLNLVKQAAAFVVERLADDDRVSVVAYDDEIRTVTKPTKATLSNRHEIIHAIKKLNTGGSTNLGEGWLTGCRHIAEYQSENRYIDTAWLLTDGLANVGITSQEELTMHAAELRKRGISTTTFGVGTDFNEDLLRAMAEKGGGNFYFIDSSSQIRNYFEGELGEKFNTVARNLSLVLRFPEGVKVENLNDYEMDKGGNRLNTHIGDIYAGEEKLVVFKVIAPKGDRGEQLDLNALLTYTNATTREGREIRAEGNLTLTYASDSACDSQALDAEVGELAVKLAAARAKQEILAANRAGDYAAAKSINATFQAQTAAMPYAAPAGATVAEELKEVEDLAQQAEAPMTAAEAKSIHYRTHMVQRSRKDYKK